MNENTKVSAFTPQCWGKSEVLKKMIQTGETGRLVHGCSRPRDANRRLLPMSDEELERHFWARVAIVEFGCWLWTKGKAGGYGVMKIDGIKRIAQRFSWELTQGTIPDGLQALHKCDNPACVRPDHLFLGTMLDNHRDKLEKGRQWRPAGELNVKAKLTENDVVAIRADLDTTVKEIAAKFQVHESTIFRVRRGASWQSV